MEPTVKKLKSLRVRWKQMLNYQSIVKQIPFFLFLAFLAVVYIYNGHSADKLSREIVITSKELKELQYEFKTVKGEVLFRSKQSELLKAVEPLGLKELTQSPIVLSDTK
ncbi:MAG: FtsL-like putative cell division protein [Chitinophagaceae bacterium]|nr:FtsL-like putative cell division protein [Chitinophagaceae bacterium]